MVIKRFFGREKSEEEQDYTIDELVILERYEEAEQKLKAKIKAKSDLHDHLKLADVFVALRKPQSAVDEYVYVAEEYARDGFYDKGLAIMSRAVKLNPTDDELPLRLDRLRQAKKVDELRKHAIEGFLASKEYGRNEKISVVEFQTVWKKLQSTTLIKHLQDDQIRLLFTGVEIQYPPGGKVLMEAGESREALMIIGRGEVEAQAPRDGLPPLRLFGPGQILGESMFFDKQPAPATLLTTEISSILWLDRAGFEGTMVGNPDPRGFIEQLRGQYNDRALRETLRKIG